MAAEVRVPIGEVTPGKVYEIDGICYEVGWLSVEEFTHSAGTEFEDCAECLGASEAPSAEGSEVPSDPGSEAPSEGAGEPSEAPSGGPSYEDGKWYCLRWDVYGESSGCTGELQNSDNGCKQYVSANGGFTMDPGVTGKNEGECFAWGLADVLITYVGDTGYATEGACPACPAPSEEPSAGGEPASEEPSAGGGSEVPSEGAGEPSEVPSDGGGEVSSDAGAGEVSSDAGAGEVSSDAGAGEVSSDAGAGEVSSDAGAGEVSSDAGGGEVSSEAPFVPDTEKHYCIMWDAYESVAGSGNCGTGAYLGQAQGAIEGSFFTNCAENQWAFSQSADFVFAYVISEWDTYDDAVSACGGYGVTLPPPP